MLLQSEHLSLKSKHDNAGFRSEVRYFIQPKLPTAKRILSQDHPGTRAFIYLFIDCMTEYSKHLFSMDMNRRKSYMKHLSHI